MTLIDSSAWIESLRSQGDPAIRDAIRSLILRGEAAWCDLVRLELWNGAQGQKEKQALRDLEAGVRRFEIDQACWEGALQLALAARSAGLSCPATDILIVACGSRYGLPIIHRDRHFSDLLALTF